jgi:hypothetical protein
MTLPTNAKAELALIRAVAQGRANFQAALALGAGPEIFSPDGPHGAHWTAVAALYERDVDPMPELLPGDTSELFSGEATTPAQTAELFKRVLRAALGRDLAKLALQLTGRASRESISAILPWLRSEIAGVESRYIRATQPTLGNPADSLMRSRAWSVRTGIGVIDNWMRLTSGEIHIFTGDPGAGKTTMAINIAANVALDGKPVLYITAETDPLEIQLSMLTQLGQPGLDVRFINRVRFDPTFRIERNIDAVRRAWDKTFKYVPLTIAKINKGPDEAISIIAALTEPHLIEIDHLYALISQTGREIAEYRQYIQFCARLLIETIFGEHLAIAWNQFTKAGRESERRGQDDGFGGSGVANIASSMLNLRKPKTDLLTTSSGFKAFLAEWVKFRVLLVEDSNGQLIDPTGQTIPYWIENRYRRVVDDINQAPEPIPWG